MTRRKRYDGAPRLYGTQEASEYLGLSRRNLTAKLARGQVVEPVAQLACGPIWSESQLDEQLYFWSEDPPGQMSVDQVEQMKLTRRLRRLEHRFDRLVASAAKKDDRKEIVAVWEGELATNRRKGGRSALAHFSEARRALAEAKVLRLVAKYREKDPVFGRVADELDEAADLRKRIQAIKDARGKRTIEAEVVGSQNSAT